MTDLLDVGRIGRPHGVRGEVYVDLTTDRTERLDPGAVLFAGGRRLVVAAARPHHDRWLVVFEQVATREEAEALTNLVVSAEPLDDPSAVWVHELIGSRVVDRAGRDRGRCVAVIANPAHDILELESGALVPTVFVVSCVDGVTVIDPPEGLFDL